MKTQYDRVFFSGDHGNVHFSLVGTQKMAPPHSIFPSDHFGVHSRISISTAGATAPAQAAASETHKRKRVISEHLNTRGSVNDDTIDLTTAQKCKASWPIAQLKELK